MFTSSRLRMHRGPTVNHVVTLERLAGTRSLGQALPLFKVALVLVRFDHIACVIVTVQEFSRWLMLSVAAWMAAVRHLRRVRTW